MAEKRKSEEPEAAGESAQGKRLLRKRTQDAGSAATGPHAAAKRARGARCLASSAASASSGGSDGGQLAADGDSGGSPVSSEASGASGGETTAPGEQQTEAAPSEAPAPPAPRPRGRPRGSGRGRGCGPATLSSTAQIARPGVAIWGRGRASSGRPSAPRKWTSEEDGLLRDAVEKHQAKNWKEIAVLVRSRNHQQCMQRWTMALKPGMKHGDWEKAEDEQLVAFVNSGKHTWKQIAGFIRGRTTKQCRERWGYRLDPNIKRGAFNAAEDALIQQQHALLGNRWSTIARMLPGRTDDSIKMRLRALLRGGGAAAMAAPLRAAHGSSGSSPPGHGHGHDLVPSISVPPLEVDAWAGAGCRSVIGGAAAAAAGAAGSMGGLCDSQGGGREADAVGGSTADELNTNTIAPRAASS